MKKLLPFWPLVLALVFIGLISSFISPVYAFFHQSEDSYILTTFFEISVILSLSFLNFYMANKTALPNFVTAIFFGIAAQPMLVSITSHGSALGTIVALGATMILFGGGLDIPYKNFKLLFSPIMSLSFLGLLLTAFLFSFAIITISDILGSHILIMTAVLLGAILASTDPAAIIPVIKKLRFRNRHVKDLIVSESALTDVTGTLLTLVFLSIMRSNSEPLKSIADPYYSLFSIQSAVILGKQVVLGIFFGFIGFVLLEIFHRLKKRQDREFEVDPAYFFAIPVIVFTASLAFGGSGYLAAFIAGLLLIVTEHIKETEHFFNFTIEGFLKPTIFLLLGALVDFQSLISYANIGILSSLVFMFIIRPLAVFVSLGLIMIFQGKMFTLREFLFISFVRETGAIPAVLLVTIVALGFGNIEGLVPIGMWVILSTLIIQPPLTPYIAKILTIGDSIEDTHELAIDTTEPTVIYGGRGHSHLRRLPKIVEWCKTHGIRQIMLLICLEDRYSPALAQQIEEESQKEFDRINEEFKKEEHRPLKFSLIMRKGFLQDNIDIIAREQGMITAIFVGSKVLDYRLKDIKNLAVPLYFMR